MSQVTTTKIIDGHRNAVLHYYVEADGTGDIDEQTILDPAVDLLPNEGNVPSLTLQRIWYDLTGFDGTLVYSYLTSHTPLWSMTGDHCGDYDFNIFGGIKDRSDPMDGEGKVLLSTVGLGGQDFGTFILMFRKG